MRTVYRVFFHFSLMLAGTVALAQSNPVPFINQPLVPMTAAPGGSGFTLTVNGTEFVSTSVVNWNGTALATTFVTSSQLTAAVPATDIATAGTASVTVSNPSPGGGTSNVEFFDVSSVVSSLIFTQLPPSPGIQGCCSQVIAADFNGDGNLDLAYISATGTPPSYVVIQLGKGNGGFQTSVNYPVGSEPYHLVAGDFNGDGKLDLAVTNVLDNTISILLGNGDGTFKAQTTLSTGAVPITIVAGDFNGDGKLDLATGNQFNGGAGGVSILLGNGDGTFQGHVEYGTGTDAYALIVGDFNGDGKLDLISSTGPGQLSFLEGNGDGTFQSPQSFPANNDVESLITADFNQDGKLDLVTADLGGC